MNPNSSGWTNWWVNSELRVNGDFRNLHPSFQGTSVGSTTLEGKKQFEKPETTEFIFETSLFLVPSWVGEIILVRDSKRIRILTVDPITFLSLLLKSCPNLI